MADENEFIERIKGSAYKPLPAPQIDGDIAIRREVAYAVKVGFRNLNLSFFSSADDDSIRPLIIWLHGGAFMFGNRMSPPPFLTVDNLYYKMVRAGYNVASIDYRFSGEAHWPAQLEDAIDAVTWLQNRAADLSIDPRKIAIWGESAGAHIAVCTGIRFNNQVRTGRNGQQLEKIAAVVDWFGPIDFLKMDSQGPATAAHGQPHDAPDSPESLLIGAPIQSVPELVADANPLNFIDENSPAFHIRHGQDDRLVALGQSELLAEALSKQGIACDFEKIPGADHGFDGMKDSHLLVDVGLKYLDGLFSRHA